MSEHINLDIRYAAHTYNPLPVVLVKGRGAIVWDEQGNEYLDMMGAYSAANHGHCHPGLVNALTQQAEKLGIVSRAFHNDQLGLFLKQACELFDYEKALPMNSGAEAVETAIKAARKWAYTVKGISDDRAQIITCQGNFHGRTTTITGFSTEESYRAHFGPFTPGFVTIPYGDVKALENAITDNTAAFLVEPVQGEAGIIVPPEGYLHACEKLCRKRNVLLICDEIQTGLGRTGKLLACSHEHVKPDGLILGKSLGGGLIPVSLFLANNAIMDVLTPGDHGSTFGGSPLAAHVGSAALTVLIEEKLSQRADKLGNIFIKGLKKIKSPVIHTVRGKGLMVGIEVHPDYASARDVCLALLEEGVLSKDTHNTVVRLTPPLVINEEQIHRVLNALEKVFAQFG